MTKIITLKDEKIKKLLNDLEIKLSEVFKNNLKKIILFGSYAKGNYNNESDIDIMVLLTETDLNKYDDVIADIVIELIGKYSIYPSILIENEHQFYKNIQIEALFKNVENEGIELYAA
jgi:predicted nucleotidyltransferase